MDKKTLRELQKATEQVAAGKSAEEKIFSLQQAFNLFSKETERLEKAYASLKEQFQALNNELKDTNAMLEQKVDQLAFISSYLDAILSNITQGILFIDSRGKITTCNPVAANILNVDGTAVLLKAYSALFPDELLGFSVSRALRDKKAVKSFPLLVDSSGDKIELEVETAWIRANTAEAVKASRFIEGLLVIMRNVTVLHTLERLASRNDRMKELGEMAAKVAHEIRNPLSGIKGFASLLVRDFEGETDKQKLAQYIVDGADTINRLVTNVLNYSRPIVPLFTFSNLHAFLDTLKIDVAHNSAIGPNVDIVVESQEKELTARIDIQMMKLALLDLIVNAAEAMPSGGSITIGLKRSGSNALITVSDIGEGISSENMEKIFTPFFTTKEKGNGFGLAEVYKVIQAHEGTIEVESETGKGTCFRVKIPLKS